MNTDLLLWMLKFCLRNDKNQHKIRAFIVFAVVSNDIWSILDLWPLLLQLQWKTQAKCSNSSNKYSKWVEVTVLWKLYTKNFIVFPALLHSSVNVVLVWEKQYNVQYCCLAGIKFQMNHISNALLFCKVAFIYNCLFVVNEVAVRLLQMVLEPQWLRCSLGLILPGWLIRDPCSVK